MPAGRLNTPVPLYGGVPPVAETVTVELPLLHTTGVALELAVSDGGCVMLSEAMAEQPFASVTVKEYVPAVRLKLPVPVYGAVPPVAVTVTVDVEPLQRIGVAVAVTVSVGGAVMVAVAVAVQLFASVTVKVKMPAPRVNAPVPMYGGVPPVAVTVTVEFPPVQSIGVAAAAAVRAGGSVIVTLAVPVQLLASVTVKVC